jgi:hypothetical protein
MPTMAISRYLKTYPALDRHRAEMRSQARRRRMRLAIGGLLGLGLCVAGYLITPPLGVMLAGVMAMALFFASIGGSSTVPAHELSGIEGELRALDALKQLPDDCSLFNRIQLPDDWLPNGQRELDFIVVAPAGLYVVEVKNSSGRIHVDPDSKHWPLASRGCGGRPNWQAVANPLPQVQAQVQALERWLLKQGLSFSAQPVVCFSRSDVILENVDASPIPVVIPEQLQSLITVRQQPASLLAGQRESLELVLAGLAGIRAPTTAAVA